MVHGHGTSYVKIGKTTNVFGRLQELQQGVPFALHLISLSLVADVDAAEQELLQRYQQFRTRGEWFLFPGEVLAQWPLAQSVPVSGQRIVDPPVVQPVTLYTKIERVLLRQGAVTARRISQCIHGSTSREICDALQSLRTAGRVTITMRGKATLYTWVTNACLTERDREDPSPGNAVLPLDTVSAGCVDRC